MTTKSFNLLNEELIEMSDSHDGLPSAGSFKMYYLKYGLKERNRLAVQMLIYFNKSPKVGRINM